MVMASPAITTTTAAITITITTTIPTKSPATCMDEGALFDVLSWMSPAWPIGAYAHSGGLEWAVEAGHVTSRASCQSWLADLLAYGPLRNEALLFIHAFGAAAADDATRLAGIAELAVAAQSGGERHLEATAQGSAFRRIARSATGPSRFDTVLALVPEGALAYTVAAATLFACHDIPMRAALAAYLHGCIANLVSAAQRLVPLGQTDGQGILFALRPAVVALAQSATASHDPFDDLAGCSLVAEIGCMAHETQYTRLFRT